MQEGPLGRPMAALSLFWTKTAQTLALGCVLGGIVEGGGGGGGGIRSEIGQQLSLSLEDGFQKFRPARRV